MHIVIAGASGLIGTHLSATLREAGHDVTTLVRREPTSAAEIRWDPAARRLDPAALAGADAVVNLSGAGIGDRPWTRRRIDELLTSRLDPTRTLVAAMAKLEQPPQVFVSQSGSNYYGDRGTAVLRENSPNGKGIMARICREWEAAAHEAPSGVRVITPRTGVVLSPAGGALGRLLPLLRLGLGGPLGNGRQYWPWITLPDVAAAFLFLADSGLHGPVNVCAPENADVNALTGALASALHRPAFFRVPSPALRLVMWKLADELILSSQRMEPAALEAAGFQWQHPSLAQAAAWVAGKH
ncbi:TIGR01777 family oxidoreductase [Pseudarthrobacter raffinosi]|uniref:TIGR01777 family oxidoreductase n=1 Tax=Pseudarthrobacter raffinosi TaxID=2953651 RepID=UPI00208EE39A|nr:MULTISPECIES: TIGR01777 family oxidoreductase [unclassified Pseudarthrobacter]MCO4237909.1 TIGR01777 family oxidoreductase [Pseudarthrobacter sp. MDT3-28]MCO4251085.1 TIGR01777 family oxidoreductase [Pseudarthrobacter sp. MDT3-9]MCO4263051.1 TIGR01777 family oxidoreductase [Pseudarthrobacter sp. MDT3-26]